MLLGISVIGIRCKAINTRSGLFTLCAISFSLKDLFGKIPNVPGDGRGPYQAGFRQRVLQVPQSPGNYLFEDAMMGPVLIYLP